MKPPTTPRCSCEDPAAILYDGRYWCGFCALLCVGDFPAARFAELQEAFTEIGPRARFLGVIGNRVAMTASRQGAAA